MIRCKLTIINKYCNIYKRTIKIMYNLFLQYTPVSMLYVEIISKNYKHPKVYGISQMYSRNDVWHIRADELYGMDHAMRNEKDPYLSYNVDTHQATMHYINPYTI